jgi:hypothetical protein
LLTLLLALGEEDYTNATRCESVCTSVITLSLPYAFFHVLNPEAAVLRYCFFSSARGW